MKLNSKYLARILVLAGLYIITAKLGLSLAFGVKQITTVWPPSALALAALIIYGRELWPGVLIGAFVANLITNEPTAVAAGIAIGNTLEAVVGATLLTKIVDFKPALLRIKGLMGLLLLGAVLSTMVAATVGTLSLALGGIISWNAYSSNWLLWWFGDMAGIILFAPAILVWYTRWRQAKQFNSYEFSSLVLGSAAVAYLVFFNQLTILGTRPQGPYLVFPFIIWAALRFKQLGMTAVAVIVSVIAILGTVYDHGPFAMAGTSQQQLISLLSYILVLNITGLVLAVTVSQRDSYEDELVAQTKQLEKAGKKIELELRAKTRDQRRLEASNDRIVKIMSQLLDEDPRRHQH